jgi:hypothetical protein
MGLLEVPRAEKSLSLLIDTTNLGQLVSVLN